MAEYFDKEALRNHFAQRLFRLEKNAYDDYTQALCDDCKVCLRIIDVFPTTNVASIAYGQWEWFDEETGTPLTGYEREWGWRCSHCKHELPDDYDDPDCRPMLNYCSNCGAKMDENS